MKTGTLTSKGQTTIPKQVRDALNLKIGDKLVWTLKDGQAILRAKNKSIKDLAGILHRPGVQRRTIAQIGEGIAQAAAQSALAGLERKK